jgi:DNA-binding NtrC family response regulator
MHKLLVIDDDPEVHSIVKHLYEQKEVHVCSARTPDEGFRQARELKPEVILLDYKLGERTGLQLMQELKEISENSLVVFITGHGSTDTVIEAMKQGAHDYLVKPIDLYRLEQVISRAFEITEHATTDSSDSANQPKSAAETEKLIGNSAAMQTVAKEIGRVAAQDVTVLILGESGTGVTRDLRAQSPQSGSFHRDQLRRDSGSTAGKRAVWSRKRGVHRCRPPTDWKVRTVP